jgi:hypothetical protein
MNAQMGQWGPLNICVIVTDIFVASFLCRIRVAINELRKVTGIIFSAQNEK